MFSAHQPNGFATLVGPNEGETAVCGCHFPLDMAVRIHEVLARPWVGVCGSLHYVCTNFNVIELSSIYFSSITVFHDISKQIQQRARIGKIFARWHLAIAIAGVYTAISKKVVGKMYTRQSRKVIWDMINNTLFLTTVAVEPTFVAFL